MKNLELAATPTAKEGETAVAAVAPSFQPIQEVKAPVRAGKYLTFMLGCESYGIEVLKIREIIRMQEITVVPQMPEYVKGVINLRGKIIPILDLRLKFELPAEASDSICIIVVQLQEMKGLQNQIGLIVDGVEEVINIVAGDIEDAPHFGSSVSTKYIVGMAKVKGVVKILVDIDRIIGGEVEVMKSMAMAS